MLDVRLYLAQRISAMVMAPLVLTHIVVMIVAIQGGLSSDEILSRTQGSMLWLSFYGLFVLAASVHGAIGLRVIVRETIGLRGRALSVLTWGFGLTALWLGGQAVLAVTLS